MALSGAGVCMIIVLGTILFRRIGAPIVAREKAERALQQAHDMLEKAVEQRTAQLRETNRQLEDDISRRIKAEESLRVSEARFRDFAETASDWFWETDAEDRFVYVSREFFDISGIPPETIVGRTRREVYEEYYEPAGAATGWDWNAAFPQFDERHPFRDAQVSYTRPDGSRHFFRTNGKPVFDQNGAFLGYRGTSSDITERNQIQEALLESETRFRTFAEALPQVVFEAEADGVVTFINRNGLELTGFEEEYTDGKLSVYDLIAPGDRDRVRQTFNEIHAGTETGPIECMGQRKSGGTFPILVQSTAVLHDGNPAGFRGMVFDITKRREPAG